jgi:shikimate kinase/3-dehydroquinate synthase
MPPIFLYGPPGSGKSTIGKRLAEHLRLAFVDLDEQIGRLAGMDISRIMAERGEAGFRDLESEELQRITANADAIIALGGGTLLREENRRLAERKGQIVCLRTEAQTLFLRLQESGERPLLMGDLREKLDLLLADRREHYDLFPLQVNTDRSPEQVARQIQIALGRFHLHAMGGYDVLIREGGLNQLGEMLEARGLEDPILVTDENVAKFHSQRALDSLRGSNYDPQLLVIPAGESFKTLDTVTALWKGFLEAGLDRRSTVIALGGGVIGDLAGFAASTFMRGIHWVGVPTTLLAMVDASLGGKTGFDLPEGKNLIGSFYPPRLVLIDVLTLKTLPEVELRAGFAEVVKHGIISDPGLFACCGEGYESVKENVGEIVPRAVPVKIDIIEQDPYERGVRASLNFGHTVGHAVELVSRFRLKHGEAVAIGMVAEARLAERLNVADQGVAEAISHTLGKLGLPVCIPKDLSHADLLHVMRVDKKKAAGVVRFALPVRIGEVKVGVEVMDLERVFEEVA